MELKMKPGIKPAISEAYQSIKQFINETIVKGHNNNPEQIVEAEVFESAKNCFQQFKEKVATYYETKVKEFEIQMKAYQFFTNWGICSNPISEYEMQLINLKNDWEHKIQQKKHERDNAKHQLNLVEANVATIIQNGEILWEITLLFVLLLMEAVFSGIFISPYLTRGLLEAGTISLIVATIGVFGSFSWGYFTALLKENKLFNKQIMNGLHFAYLLVLFSYFSAVSWYRQALVVQDPNPSSTALNWFLDFYWRFDNLENYAMAVIGLFFSALAMYAGQKFRPKFRDYKQVMIARKDLLRVENELDHLLKGYKAAHKNAYNKSEKDLRVMKTKIDEAIFVMYEASMEILKLDKEFQNEQNAIQDSLQAELLRVKNKLGEVYPKQEIAIPQIHPVENDHLNVDQAKAYLSMLSYSTLKSCKKNERLFKNALRGLNKLKNQTFQKILALETNVLTDEFHINNGHRQVRNEMEALYEIN